MKTLLAACALLTLTACGSDGGTTVTDPAGSDDNEPMPALVPSSVPAAEGPVRTRNLATVMDTGSPELCLGPVAESYPPQCGGPPLVGWSWKDHDGVFEREGDVRWGQFAVTGTFDGTTFTVDSAIPAALYDTAATAPPKTPDPEVELSEDELADIAEEVGGTLPGAQGAYPTDGHVFVDVTHDDGSLQAWADEEYGENVVLVSSALVPVD